MTGNEGVISGIQTALEKTNQAFDLLHNQEHLWELEGFDKLEKWFDKANRDVWCIHHSLLKRLYKLGGWPDGVTDDPVTALTRALSAFNGLHDACEVIYEAAEEADDYVTSDKLARLQSKIEEWIVATEQQLKKIGRLKPSKEQTPFMAEQM